MANSHTKSLFTADLVVPAIKAAFLKLNPRELIRNPVMFVTAVVAALMTVLLVGIVLILGGLTFLPSLALGPIADHLTMIRGQLF